MTTTLINGNRQSFVSLTVNLNGDDQVRGCFLSIDYGCEQSPGEIYSKTTSQLVGTTPGYCKCTGDFEMLVSEWDSFASALTNSGQFAITTPIFAIKCAFATNDTDDVRTDQMLGARITNARNSNRGTGASTVVCSFLFTTLLSNGIVVGGDVSAAQQQPQFDVDLGTPVTSDFWAPLVYAASNGTWYAPGFSGNTYFYDPWDAVGIAVPSSSGVSSPQTPGICDVKARKYRDVDKNKKAAGTDGKRVTLHGIEPAEGEIEITIWTPEQFRQLMALWPVLFPGPQKFTTTQTVTTTALSSRFEGSGDETGITSGQTFTIPQTPQTQRISTTQTKSVPRAFDVTHPTFKQLDIKSVVFVSGEGPNVGSVPFSRTFTMRWVEFMLPGQVNATISPQAAKSTTFQPSGYQTPGSDPRYSNLVP